MHNEAIEKWQQELAVLNMQGRWESDQARRIRQQIETAGHRMTELYQTGVIKKLPLTLVEVS